VRLSALRALQLVVSFVVLRTNGIYLDDLLVLCQLFQGQLTGSQLLAIKLNQDTTSDICLVGKVYMEPSHRMH